MSSVGRTSSPHAAMPPSGVPPPASTLPPPPSIAPPPPSGPPVGASTAEEPSSPHEATSTTSTARNRIIGVRYFELVTRRNVSQGRAKSYRTTRFHWSATKSLSPETHIPRGPLSTVGPATAARS